PTPTPAPTPTPTPTPDPESLSVKSVMSFTTIEVVYGGNQPDLPEIVTIVLSDDSEIEVPVYWSDLNVYLEGEQIIDGMLDLSDYEHVAATDLRATIQVIVYISEEDRLIAVDIDNEIMELPDVSELTLDDEDRVSTLRERYNNLTYAQQSLVTKLSILEAAETKIIELKEEVPDGLWVIELMEFDIIELEYGASNPALPERVILILSDYSEAYVPVQWSGEINVYLEGTQTFTGTLDLSNFEHVTATDLTVTIQVIVGEEVAPPIN
ncbi:MAG TPA: hypothetical protein GX731_08460, partial [Clostridiales bacterium]|nr:hypothetical protein [Clostridiales bacterium]